MRWNRSLLKASRWCQFNRWCLLRCHNINNSPLLCPSQLQLCSSNSPHSPILNPTLRTCFLIKKRWLSSTRTVVKRPKVWISPPRPLCLQIGRNSNNWRQLTSNKQWLVSLLQLCLRPTIQWHRQSSISRMRFLNRPSMCSSRLKCWTTRLESVQTL
jgi:hypothetical protein